MAPHFSKFQNKNSDIPQEYTTSTMYRMVRVLLSFRFVNSSGKPVFNGRRMGRSDVLGAFLKISHLGLHGIPWPRKSRNRANRQDFYARGSSRALFVCYSFRKLAIPRGESSARSGTRRGIIAPTSEVQPRSRRSQCLQLHFSQYSQNVPDKNRSPWPLTVWQEGPLVSSRHLEFSCSLSQRGKQWNAQGRWR